MKRSRTACSHRPLTRSVQGSPLSLRSVNQTDPLTLCRLDWLPCYTASLTHACGDWKPRQCCAVRGAAQRDSLSAVLCTGRSSAAIRGSAQQRCRGRGDWKTDVGNHPLAALSVSRPRLPLYQEPRPTRLSSARPATAPGVLLTKWYDLSPSPIINNRAQGLQLHDPPLRLAFIALTSSSCLAC